MDLSSLSRRLPLILATVLIVCDAVSAQDLRLPDSLVIGNLDGSPIPAGLGQQVAVPVWVKMDDTVAFMVIPVASDNDYVVSRDSGLFHPPFSAWPQVGFDPPSGNNPQAGFTNQSLTAFNPNLNPPIPPEGFLNQWLHVADFLMTVTDDPADLGTVTMLSEGHYYQEFGVWFQTYGGETVFTPHMLWGSLRIVSAGPDEFIVGNLDRSPTIVYAGTQAAVPIWIYSDPANMHDSIAFMHIPIATDDDYVTARQGGTLFWPLTTWDDITFLSPNPGQPNPGFTNQSIVGYCSLSEPYDEIFLHTSGEYWHIADLLLSIPRDTSVIGDTTRLIEGYHPINAGPAFMCQNDMNIHVFTPYYGLLRIECLPGDCNGSGSVNGVDITFLVAYFKGIGPAPWCLGSGDANGNCAVNGLDVVYLVAYLKGIGPAPVMGDCE